MVAGKVVYDRSGPPRPYRAYRPQGSYVSYRAHGRGNFRETIARSFDDLICKLKFDKGIAHFEKL